MNNAALKLDVQYLFKSLFSVSLGTYLEMGQILIPHLAVLETTKLFSMVVVPFHIPTNGTQKLQFLPIFDNICYFLVIVSFLK
jgi:hypothetical protein